MNMGRWSWCTKQAHFPTKRGLLKPDGLELQPPRNSCWQRRAPSADFCCHAPPCGKRSTDGILLGSHVHVLKNLVARKPLCWKAPALIKFRPLPLPCVFWTCEQVSAPQQSTEKYSVAVASLAPASQPKNHKTSSTKHHLLCRVPKRGVQTKRAPMLA